jgi:hypothetical protein
MLGGRLRRGGDMSIHNDVLRIIGKVSFQLLDNKYYIKTEIENGKIYLPFGEGYENRRTNLIYADAILYENDSPISVIEIVHSSPIDPNGITGHIINVDRCCEINTSIRGILYIVISNMKTFYCEICDAGHKLDINNKDHFNRVLKMYSKDNTKILHDGPGFNYKKAVIEFNIMKYLRYIKNISIGFVNDNISIYKNNDMEKILGNYVKQHTNNKCIEPVFYGIEELIPQEIKTST